MRQELLDTWFADGPDSFRMAWFARDDAFDAMLRARFGHALLPAREGALDGWLSDAKGALALLLLLDQLPRNLHRGTAEAFASDAKARAAAREAIFTHRHHHALTPVEQTFLFLPFEHSESLADQELSVALFEGLRHDPRLGGPGGAVDYAWRHLDVIRRFGRFPHRNKALGRADTAEESAYLAEPGAGF